MAHPNTLFLLCPFNEMAHEALNHPENRRFVSPGPNNQIGLGIGFHVSRVPGRVMARIGRGHNADLVLPGRDISSVHVAFEVHPETYVVLLSVRTKNTSSVTVVTFPDRGEILECDCVLVYGQKYNIEIGGYQFIVIWQLESAIALKSMAKQELQRALERERHARSRDLPTEDNSTLHTWHNTRIHTANRPLFCEAPGAERIKLGSGSFGSVFAAVDCVSGWPFAIKVIDLSDYEGGIEYARSAAHAEVKFLQGLKHKNIIEFLGIAKWDTNEPEIFMPMCTGSLQDLVSAKNIPCSIDNLCLLVLEQILSALDCTAFHRICHRDVKPENILYFDNTGKGKYTFQLADFGLAKNQQSALHYGGTMIYSAPELFAIHNAPPQSPVMDVWSLFATIIKIHPNVQFPPPMASSYGVVFKAVQAAAQREPTLADMAREDPSERASAAQMLVALFNGRGLTTPRNQIKSLPNARAPAPVRVSVPVPEPGPQPYWGMRYAGPAEAAAGRAARRHDPGIGLPVKQSLPLIKYPRNRPQLARAGARGAAGLLTTAGVGGAMAVRAGIVKPAAPAGVPAQKIKEKPSRARLLLEQIAGERFPGA